MRKILIAALFLAGIFSSRAALASGDDTCEPSWSLTGAAYDTCNSVPFLSPSNDSRINLLLLAADRGSAGLAATPLSDYDRNLGYGQVPIPAEVLLMPGGDAAAPNDASTDYASGDGTRCRSNNTDTSQAFIDQVNAAADLSPDEKAALTASRTALVSVCNTPATAAPGNLTSPLAKEFAQYLAGAQAFYAGDFPAAAQAFGGLGGSNQPWLKETALYMVARNALNAAQANAFDDMGFVKLEAVDQGQLKAAEAGFTAYLQAYPQGLYAASARGLMRRVYWLAGDQEHLAGQSGLTAPQVLALAQEADNKLLAGADPAKVKDPLLLAVVDLMAMRQTDATQPAKPFTSALLAAQQPLFASQPELYAYLQAAQQFYVEKNPAGTLAALPDIDGATPLKTYLAFSQAMLRGLALEATGDHPQAQALWTKLISSAQLPLARPAVELALAANAQRTHRVDSVFAADSLIESPEIKSLLLRKVAGPALLRQQIKAQAVPQQLRDTALFVLLYKDLTRGHYQDFASDLTLAPLPDRNVVPDEMTYSYFGGPGNLAAFTKAANAGNDADPNYACPTLAVVASRLDRNKKDALGLNCLGEFIRTSYDFSPLDQAPLAQTAGGDALGAGDSDFQGKVFSRLDGYMTVIGDAKASRDDKAYALYRAINCFAPSGNNDCDGQDIPRSQRKKWFETLKSRYAKTPWGSLQYYW